MAQTPTCRFLKCRRLTSKWLQLLNIAKDQKVAAMLPVGDFESQSSLLMLTKKGWMKQVAVKQFKGAMKKAGLTAMALVCAA